MRRPGIVLLVMLLVGCVTMALAAKSCPSCGTSNRDDARFCKSCGYEFPRSVPARPAPPRLPVQVKVEAGTAQVQSTPPGARVTLDGRRLGNTPLTASALAPGRHSLVVELDGYRDYEGSFQVAELLGSLQVSVQPAGAEVTVDGRTVGIAGPEGLNVPGLAMGSHVVRAKLDGYEDAGTTAVLTAGQQDGRVELELRSMYGVLRVDSRPGGASLLLDGKPVALTPYQASLLPARYSLIVNKPGFEDWAGVADVRSSDTTSLSVVLTRLRTRKPALLWSGVGVLAVTGATAALGQVSYAQYKDAATPVEAERLRKETQTWDLARNVAAGFTVLLGGAYLLF